MAFFNVDESFSAKIQAAIISVCVETYSIQGIEIDGIVCVTGKFPSKNCVVRIHQNLNEITCNKSKKSHRLKENLNNHSWIQDDHADSSSDMPESNSSNQEHMYIYEDKAASHKENLRTENDEIIESDVHHGYLQNKHGHQGYHMESNSDDEREAESHLMSKDVDRRSSEMSESNSDQISDMIKKEQEDGPSDLLNDWQIQQSQKRKLITTDTETMHNRSYSETSHVKSTAKFTDDEIPEFQSGTPRNDDFEIKRHTLFSKNNLELGKNTDPRYSKPVCIDLSEINPDIVHSEREAHMQKTSDIYNACKDAATLPICSFPSSYKSNSDNEMYDNLQSYAMVAQPNYPNEQSCEGNPDGQHCTSKNYEYGGSTTTTKNDYKQSFKKPLFVKFVGLVNKPSPLDRKYHCKHCGLGFTNSGNKNRHERSTCGAVKYKCQFCDMVFSRSDSRGRHMMFNHGLMIKDRKSNGSLKKSSEPILDDHFNVPQSNSQPVFPDFQNVQSITEQQKNIEDQNKSIEQNIIEYFERKHITDSENVT